MAALLIIGIAIGALFAIAQAEGVDVGSEFQDLKDKLQSGFSSVTGSLGLSNDPISIALPIVKNFEGFSAAAYPDPPGSGKYSIGYGHQIQPGESYTPSSVISESEASDLLRADIASAYSCVTDNVTVELTPNQAAALISFAFNIGCSHFQSSSMLSFLNQGDFDSAAAQFPQWIHAGGAVSDALVSRRQQEQELFTA